MGASFTNVQVRAVKRSPEEVRTLLSETIRQWLVVENYEEVAGQGSADRTVVIGPAGTEPWITVYDEATENAGPERLDALASTLSLAAEEPAVGIMVRDSEIVLLHLFAGGAAVDVYERELNAPASGETQRPSGRPEAWRDLLTAGATVDELRAAWDARCNLAEDILLRSAVLFGWHPRHSLTGQGNLNQHQLENSIKLRFRQIQKPVEVEKASGPPAVKIASTIGKIELTVGTPLMIALGARNVGGASKGLSVILSGPAVEKSLIYPERVVIRPGLQGRKRESSAPLETVADNQGEAAFAARFPEFQLPAGLAKPSGPLPLGLLSRRIEALSESEFHVTVSGTGLAPGTAELDIHLVPDANPADGQVIHKQSVCVTPLPRRPLRCVNERDQTVAYFLKEMEKPRTLFALVALGAGREAAAGVCGKAFASWHRLISAGAAGIYELIARDDLSSKPTFALMKVEELGDEGRLAEILSGLERKVYLKMTLRRRQLAEEESPWAALSRTSGFSLYNTSLFLEKSRDHDRPAPQVVLWFNLENADPAAAEQATSVLRGLVDGIFAKGDGLQAFLACWANAPADPSSYSTAYESACNLHGQCTAGSNWCGRFLRGVSRTIWLGPRLFEHLSDAEALRKIAEIRMIGSGVRISLFPSANLDDLELALAPILPSQADWRGAIRKMYGRNS